MMMGESWYGFGDGEVQQSQKRKKYYSGSNILSQLINSMWLAVYRLHIFQGVVGTWRRSHRLSEFKLPFRQKNITIIIHVSEQSIPSMVI
jgi:hypothetical protein